MNGDQQHWSWTTFSQDENACSTSNVHPRCEQAGSREVLTEVLARGDCLLRFHWCVCFLCSAYMSCLHYRCRRSLNGSAGEHVRLTKCTREVPLTRWNRFPIFLTCCFLNSPLFLIMTDAAKANQQLWRPRAAHEMHPQYTPTTYMFCFLVLFLVLMLSCLYYRCRRCRQTSNGTLASSCGLARSAHMISSSPPTRRSSITTIVY